MRKSSLLFVVFLYLLFSFVIYYFDLSFSPWQKLTSMPITRTEMGSAVVNGEVYLFGGYLHPGSLSASQKYSPGTDSWFSLRDLPKPLDHIAAVGYENYIYLIGGFYLAEEGIASDEVFRYSVTEDKWDTVASLPQPLGAVSAILVGKNIHVFGGIGKNHSSVNSHYIYDIGLNQWSEAPVVPVARDHMAAATDGTRIFLTGGWGSPERHQDSLLARLFVYDIKTRLWIEGPPQPFPRGDVYGAMVGKYFVLAGGENDKNKVLDIVEAFNTETDQWSTLPPLRSARHGSTAVSLGDYFYLIGGRGEDHSWGYTGLNERLKIQ